MKAPITLALASLAVAAWPALAQDNADSNYNAERAQRLERLERRQEDLRRYGWSDIGPDLEDNWQSRMQPYRAQRRDRFGSGEWECFNPRARVYEEVRKGEYQDDLDYDRCRPRHRRWR